MTDASPHSRDGTRSRDDQITPLAVRLGIPSREAARLLDNLEADQ